MNFTCPYCTKRVGVIWGGGATGLSPCNCPYCNNRIALSINLFSEKANLIAAAVGSLVLWPFLGFAGSLICLSILIVSAIEYRKAN